MNAIMISKVYAMASSPVDAGAQPPAQGLGAMLFPAVVIIAIFYFLIIRPQKKRDDEHKKFLEGLKKGDEVVTQSGIFGRIAGFSPSQITLEVAQNVKIKVAKTAVAGLAAPESNPESKV